MNRKPKHNKREETSVNTYATYSKEDAWYACILIYLDKTRTLVAHEREGDR